MNRLLLALATLACQACFGQTRYALSFTGEGGFAAGLRVPGAATGNLLLFQPSFGYKYKDAFRFSVSLAGLAVTRDETHTQARVRETYIGLSAGDLDLTIGKRILRWGTGYAFTATGILDPPRSATDPTDRLNLNEGREMAVVDWVAGEQDFTVAWASAGLLDRHRPGMRETAAFRYNVLLDGFDASVIVARDRGGSTFSGANFTRVFGQAVEIHGELAWRDGAAALAGGKYTFRSGVTAIAEFYTTPATPAAAVRRHYGFLRAGKSRLREMPRWKEWDIAASIVANLDDGSRVLVLDAGRRFANHFYAYTHMEAPAGRQGRSQFGAIPYSALVSVGVTVHI
jgi:hypothetical protein